MVVQPVAGGRKKPDRRERKMPKSRQLKAGDTAPDFSAEDVRGETFQLSSFKGEKQVVLVFLRYAGCPLCQLAMAELKNRYTEFTDRGAEVAVFVQSPSATLFEQGAADFPFHVIPDPGEKYYKLYGVGSGNIFDIVHPDVIRKGLKATVKGHMQGKMEGNTWQLPGDFIVDTEGVLKLARIGDNVGDHLGAGELLAHL